MAIEQLLGTLPARFLRVDLSKLDVANVASTIVVIAVLGILADYAWMLNLRSRMVRGFL